MSKCKVVLIDDEVAVKKTLNILVDSDHPSFQIIGEANDGLEGLALIERVNPDLVITDIRMPVMDGLTLVKEMRERSIETEVIIISGYDTFDYAQQALRYGVKDYLLKPISAQNVAAIFNQIEEKIRKERKKAQESQDWLMSSKTRLKELAMNIWVLNEKSAMLTLEEIVREFFVKECRYFTYREMYLKLFTLLNLQMSEIREKMAPLIDFSSLVQLNNQEDMQAAFQPLIREYMERIREMRKWSSYNPMIKAVRYIQDHYNQSDLSILDISRFLEMSPSYLSKTFKCEIGETFTEYLTKLRMNKALQLLDDTNLKVYEIAQAVGYNDQTHFSKAFKKQYGVSPSDYRNQI